MFLKKVATELSIRFDAETQPKGRPSGKGPQRSGLIIMKKVRKWLLNLFILTPTQRARHLPHVRAGDSELLKHLFQEFGTLTLTKLFN